MQLKEFKSLLESKMSRKEFIIHVGLLILSIFGITAMFRNITNTFSYPVQSKGYGSSAYGGKKKNG